MNDPKRTALTDITRAVMNLMDAWHLETREMQAILALPDSVRARAFNKFREGEAVFPDEPQGLADHLSAQSANGRTLDPSAAPAFRQAHASLHYSQ